MAPKSKADHLCVLVHGYVAHSYRFQHPDVRSLWGNPGHLNHIRDDLRAEHGDELHMLSVGSNAQYNTYDGIEIGAERIANEIEKEIAKVTKEGMTLKKISVVGYSLGGLIARYVVGLLYKDGVFERLEPINFTTFASPWIGVRSPSKGMGVGVWNAIAPRTLSVSGSQMFCIDKFRDTGRPLLAVMADSNSIFYNALRRFKKRTLYANTINDRSVPFYTAAFTKQNPFVDLDLVDMHYLPKQKEKCLLDPANPVTLKDKNKLGSTYERFKIRTTRIAKKLPFLAMVTVMFPIAATAMLVNSGYQSYKSQRRIQLHETGKALVNPKKYRIALLEEAQAIQDRNLERLAADVDENYLPTPPPEPAAQGEVKEKGVLSDFPTLALTAEQFKMIEQLDKLGFEKYFCHITKHRHTHAAVIVRYDNANFGQGQSVVTHWVENFEI